MKILNFVVLSIINLLSNLCHTWNVILIIEQFLQLILQLFRTLKLDSLMEREEQPNAGQAAAALQPAVEPMDEDDSDDSDISFEAEELTDEEDMSDVEDDLRRRFDNFSDSDLLVSSSSNESDSDTFGGGSKNTPRLLKHFRQSLQKSLYTFQPLRLIKRNYKLYNSVCGYPRARSGHRVIASDSNLYSLGGYNPHRSISMARHGRCLLFQELWRYNFATNHWKLLLDTNNAHNMPKELASNALAIHNNVLISHGGTGFPFGESCSNDCYVYTTGDKPIVSRLKTNGDLPTAQYGPGIVIHKDYLYTIGGTTGFDYSCDVYRLNLKTRLWENVYICRPEMRDDPEGRYRHEVVYDGQRIYVLGGGTSHTVYDMQRIPAFNLKSNSWDYFDTLPDRTVPATTADAQEAGFPAPRKCFSCVQHTASNGDIEAFITGGMQADAITYFSDIWKLNLHTKQWTWIRTAYLPRPLYFHSAAQADNGCMYIFGGIEYSARAMRRRNDLYKMWMTIPKLSEICWDAVTYYNEQLNRYDRSALLGAGIPERFVQRIAPLNSRKHLHTQHSQFALALLSKRPRSQSE